MTLILFCMASIGLTAILVDGKIFQPVRNRLERVVDRIEYRRETSNKNTKMKRTWYEFFWEMITCYQCCGFWSGLFCGIFLVWGTCHFKTVENWCFAIFMLLVCGLSSSFLNTVYLMIVELVFAQTMFLKRQNPEQTSEQHENFDANEMP